MPWLEANVQAAAELHNATTEVTTKTKDDILTLVKQLKPATPKSFTSLIGTPRTFANLLEICFGKCSPLYVDLVLDVIAPLAQQMETAKVACCNHVGNLSAILTFCARKHAQRQNEIHGRMESDATLN